MNFTATESRKKVRPAYAAFLDRLDKDDDGGNFTAADERYEILRISRSYYDSLDYGWGTLIDSDRAFP